MSEAQQSGTGRFVHGTPRGRPFMAPSRNPVSTSGHCMRGSFASLKNRGPVKFESNLERYVFCLLEFAPTVVQYSHQPPRMQICVDGRMRRYTPDIAVQWRGGTTWLVEVKPSDIASQPAWQMRFEAARIAARALGHEFVVVTERHVNRPGMDDVHRWLECRRRSRTERLGDPQGQDALQPSIDVPPQARVRLDKVLAARGQIRVSEAKELLGGATVGAVSLDALLSIRHVVAPLSERVSDSTFIHAFTESDDEELFV